MWIDSHCHLLHDKIKPLGETDILLENCRQNQVEALLIINCRIVEELPKLLEFAKGRQNIWLTIGTHPHEASHRDEIKVTAEDMQKIIAENPQIIGVGESGLDYFYDFSDRKDQEISFRKHIQVCIEKNIPLVVHARDADQDIIAIIKDETSNKGMKGIMHCFSSSPWMAEEALALGFHISFSGMITFKKSDDLRSICKSIPLNRLLVETDAPYLSPEPVRGKINEPAHVIYTGQKMADIHGVSEHELARITKENFLNLFERARLQDGGLSV
jgi:TatD DNase family protein